MPSAAATSRQGQSPPLFLVAQMAERWVTSKGKTVWTEQPLDGTFT
ncbi:hypothetical protein [Streptomyces sp. NPDC005209]